MGRSGRSNKISSVGILTRGNAFSLKTLSPLKMRDEQFLKIANYLDNPNFKAILDQGDYFQKASVKIQLLNRLVDQLDQPESLKSLSPLLKRAEKETGLKGKRALLKLRYLDNIKELGKSSDLKNLATILQNATDQEEDLLFLSEVIESVLLTKDHELIKKTARSLQEVEEETRDQVNIKERPKTVVTILPSFSMTSKANEKLSAYGGGSSASGVNISLENGQRLIFLSAEAAMNKAFETQSPEFEPSQIDQLTFPKKYLNESLQETLRHELIHSAQVVEDEELNQEDDSLREGLTESLNIALRPGWSSNRIYQRDVEKVESIIKPHYKDKKEYLEVLKKLNTVPLSQTKEFLKALSQKNP